MSTSLQYAVVPLEFASPTDQLPGNVDSKPSERMVVCADAERSAAERAAATTMGSL